MLLRNFALCVVTTIGISGCDYWPEQLEPLADLIMQDVSGETTAWLVEGDVVVINVANSPLYRESLAELEAAATVIAAQAVEFMPEPLESISVTFYEGEITEEAEKSRLFVFLLEENQPVLQPLLATDATGPLTLAEIQALLVGMDELLVEERETCVLTEIQDRAKAAGDPETLDPATVEFLPVAGWQLLDSFGKRLILAQVIATKAFFVCGRSGENESANNQG